MSENHRSAILRAEILRRDSTEITCALEMTNESVFIVTEDLPPIGEIVQLRLSFPRAVRLPVMSACVTQVRMSNGPGAPPGFVALFDIESEDDKQRVAEVALQLRRPSQISPKPRPLSVLLVEDNLLIRDMFAYAVDRYFRQRAGDIRLAQAADVSEAWKILRGEGGFDLILVDHILPGESGAEFVAQLRRHPAFRKISIVGMSVGGTDVQHAMLEAGVDLFLHKPIVLKDFFCTLEFLMESATPESDRGVA